MSDETEQHLDEGLLTRVRIIETQPLADRAAAYATLHDELSRRLDQAPSPVPGV
ncbi:hypothetical protein [Microbacterium stercoris]|uniref:Uncharacterized protein n=1 Tax=Microbacterium stercoris TaxID=2820289 RepID=A0A939QS37_9MICO|nr:hypothetical protein [Microbacterium stercoris]MBO3664551.1 hypothetical protein [Microbacterium stercoris]